MGFDIDGYEVEQSSLHSHKASLSLLYGSPSWTRTKDPLINSANICLFICFHFSSISVNPCFYWVFVFTCFHAFSKKVGFVSPMFHPSRKKHGKYQIKIEGKSQF